MASAKRTEGRPAPGASREAAGPRVLAIETHTIAQIPPDERHGRPRDLFTVWFTSNLMPLTVVTGALLTVTFNLPFWAAVVAVLLGNLFGGVFAALHAAQGPRLGVPQMIQSRGQYGTLGSVLVVLVAVFMYLGFFASNMVLGGQALHELAGGISVDLGIVFSGVVSLLIVVFGYDLIHGINRWFAPVFAIVLTAAVAIMVIRGLPGDFLSAGHFTFGGFVSAAVVTGVLWQIAYAPYVSDYSRYLSSTEGARPAFWNSYFGLVIGSVGPMLIGAMVGRISSNPNQVAALHGLAAPIGWLVMLVFVVGIMDTNAINAYGGVLCSITVGQTFREEWLPEARTRIAVVVVFVALTLIAALEFQATFLSSYLNFISLLLYLLIPWTAINLVDYYLVRHGEYEVAEFFRKDGGRYGRVQWPSVGMYVLGFVVEIPFMNTTLYEGPVARALGGTDISWLIGLLVTIPVYYFVTSSRLKAAKTALAK